VVGVALERSPEFVATVLGVLAAGAAYLPLDPGSPDAYLGQVFAEARPALIVTSPERARRLRSRTHASFLTSAATDAGFAAAPAEVAVVSPQDPAYVIYTSGSTGVPKGVVVSQEALLNSTAARADRYGLAGRVPLLHSPAFDLTSGVLLWTILSGGTLIIDSCELADVAGTVDLIHRHDVTHLIYPASLYGVFLDRAAHRPPTGLVAVGIGSERWSPVLIERHARLLPATSLVNEYGPTEACVSSSYALVYDGPHAEAAPLSIGRPVRNTGYLLVDRDRNPAAVRGELAITGTNLALGYLNRPELTAQRFVTLAGGQLAYLTGDLAEQTPSGDFVFLERADRQIQVGGHRVEPGHIETVLMGHPEILQAHVRARPAGEGTGSSTLVAYLVSLPHSGLPARSVDADVSVPGDVPDEHDRLSVSCDRFLREQLPAYLVPSAYVVLPELPRNPAGKIDQARLPDPALTASGPEKPTDPLQQDLATAAATILSVPAVPVDRPLTTLGASSLALIRLAGVIAQDHGVDVPISALFAAPTITRIAALVRAAAPGRRPPLLPAGTAGGLDAVYGKGFPLSGQQQQIWVLTQLAPDALAYSTQFSLLLSGPLDIDALQAALTHVVARHEILRTTFHDGPDGPVQVVHEPWTARVVVTDLTHLDGVAQDGALTDRMRAALTTGFDVTVLPLLHWHLFRLGPQSWRLLQVEHHFAHDGWSAQLFLAELRDAYRAVIAGEVPQLPALPVQYRDYAAWYQAWRGSEDFTDQLTYWRNHLQGCPREGATFTPDRPRPPVHSYRGARLDAHVAPDTVHRLDALAAECGVSRFAVFLSAFALQVWQHTRERDIVIGSALANRRQAGAEVLLGMFVNALPLRLHVKPATGITDLLHATMTALLGAQDHQELPLLDVLAELDLPRDPGRNPLFSLMFAFHDTPRPDLQIGPLTGQLVIEHNGTAKNDLNVVCVPDPPVPGMAEQRPGMTILWEYDSDLFDPGTAQALLTGFERILSVLAQASDLPVRALDLLGDAETATILAVGTGPHDRPPFETVHAGFDAAAAAHRHAVALEHAGTRWTYLQLDLRTWVLQQHLTALGVRAGSVVAVACPPGIELITAILAALRLGAAYVCLDRTQPPSRIRLMLDDARADIVVTTHSAAPHHDAEWLPADTTLLYADDPAHGPSPIATETAEPGVHPDDTAYLVYTSGSTGTPKAVVTTHRNACAAVHARTRHLRDAAAGVQSPPRTLITLPAIFDVAPHMMMWTLWSGGTIVLPDTPEQAQDPEQIRVLVDRHQVTHVNFAASFYRQLLTTTPVGWGPSLRVVAIGGEPCRPGDVAEHARRLPDVALDNEYGPTEATVWCAAVRLHPPDPDAMGDRVGVGRPLADSFMVVLSPDGDVVPMGAAGELYIGGSGVAAGYHRRPDLTWQRFVIADRGPLAGRRLYRTGDRARLAGGQFEILGRLDDQVKVRGFRVELGEVTACLLQHPDVDDAVVTLQGDGDTGKLIAYIAAGRHTAELPALLRAWTTQHLPSYMVPARYMVTGTLPRTASGKLQPAHLAALSSATEAPIPAVPPDNPRQEALLRVWSEHLQNPRLGVDDDFFACGGDSLQAIQAVARARALGVRVTVAQLMAAPTIWALDRLISSQDERSVCRTETITTRRPGGTRLALTAIQAWFFDQRFAEPDHFHQARLLDITETCDLPTLRKAVAWAVHRHDAFRTQFIHDSGNWSAVLDEHSAEDLIRDLVLPGGRDGSPSERLEPALRGLHRGFSITGRHPASVTIVTEPGSSRRWLYAIAHHLIIDTVSWQIFVDDIEQAYRTLRAGQTPPAGSAPGLAAIGQALPGAGPGDDRHWQDLAAAPKPVLTGPGPGGPPAPMGARIRIRRRLSAHAVRYLRHDAHRWHGVRAHPVLLAALQRALAPFSDRPDLYVWLEGHGRTHPAAAGLDGVIGWLTTLYPALLHAADTAAGRLIDAAAALQQQLEAIPDGGSGFAAARYLRPDSPLGRQLAAAVLPQVTVNYLGHQQTADQERILRPAAGPSGASIAAANVLPTPIDVTIAADPNGILVCEFLIDPGLLPEVAAEDLADRFAGEVEAAARLVALTPAPVPADPRVVLLIHPVGGSIDPYTELAAALGPGWDCYGLPHDASTDARTMPALARAYLDRVRAAHPARPYVLVGWSFGAALAYEMAQQAHDNGYGDLVEDLILIDPPRVAQPPDSSDVLIAHLTAVLPDQPAQVLADAVDATADLPIPARVQALAAILDPATGAPSGPGPDEDVVHRLRTLLICHAAMSAWWPAGQTGRLRLILPHDVIGDREALIATWRPRARDAMSATTVPGDHRSMLSGPGLRQITAAVQSAARCTIGGH
jgi:amino acid adenylation domain-containing protein